MATIPIGLQRLVGRSRVEGATFVVCRCLSGVCRQSLKSERGVVSRLVFGGSAVPMGLREVRDAKPGVETPG